MKRRGTFEISLALGLALSLLGLCGPAYAGDPLPDASVLAFARPKKAPAPPPVPTDLTLNGTINVATGSGLKIKAGKTTKAKDQKQWLIGSNPETTEIKIHATATLDYVKKGQMVEFSGNLVNNEKLSDKLKEFTIVARKGGKAAKNAVAKNDAAKDRPAAAAGGANAKADADEEPSLTVPEETKAGETKPAADGAAAGAKPEVAGPKTKVFGRVASVDSKSLTVTVGEKKIHADLVEIPTVNVEISSPQVIFDPNDKTKIKAIEGPGASGHLVSLTADDLSGAKIIVHGMGAESKKLGNQCLAKDMDITLARPLTGKKPTEPPKKAVAGK
jgi:hypothetical protein